MLNNKNEIELNKALVRKIFGIPVFFTRIDTGDGSFEEKTKTEFIINGEILLYNDGRVLTIWETPTEIPVIRNGVTIHIHNNATGEDFYFEGLKRLTTFKVGKSLKTIYVYNIDRYIREYLPEEERLNGDLIKIGLSNFFFGKLPSRGEIKLFSDKGGFTSVLSDASLPNVKTDFGGKRIELFMTGRYRLFKSLNYRSTNPVVLAGLSLKPDQKPEFERDLLTALQLASGNWIKFVYKEVYYNEKIARQIVYNKPLGLFNRNPIIVMSESNFSIFLAEVYNRLRRLYDISGNIRDFDVKKLVSNIIDLGLPTKKETQLLHAGIALEGMAKFWEYDMRDKGWVDNNFSGTKFLERVSDFASFYGLNANLLKKLVYIRHDQAHGMDKYVQRGKYNLDNDLIPLLNELRKSICLFLGFSGKPFEIKGN